jgi:hypothetical protein
MHIRPEFNSIRDDAYTLNSDVNTFGWRGVVCPSVIDENRGRLKFNERRFNSLCGEKEFPSFRDSYRHEVLDLETTMANTARTLDNQAKVNKQICDQITSFGLHWAFSHVAHGGA